ncbi:unnamed protein product [Laminaria digitata]
MLCVICIEQIQPGKHVLVHADHTAPTWQHELDHTDQEDTCPSRSISGDRWSVRCVKPCAHAMVAKLLQNAARLEHPRISWHKCRHHVVAECLRKPQATDIQYHSG